MCRGVPVVVVALLLSLVGCSTAAKHQSSTFAVFVKDDATDGQRDALEKKLRELPVVRDVSFETKQQAWEKFTQQFKDSPDLIAQTKPDSLPGSFRGTVSDSSFAEAVEAVVVEDPGVEEVSFSLAATSKPPVTEGVIVQMRGDLTGEERTAIETAIRAVPQSKPAKYEAKDAAYTRLKKACRDQPALAKALNRDAVAASYRFVFTFSSKTAGDPPSLSLSRLAGVDNVITVPPSAL